MFTSVKNKTITANEGSQILIYPKKIKNTIVLKIKTGYKLQLLTNETMKLLEDGPIIDQNKNCTNIPELKIVESVLLHCNVVENDYLQNSKLLYTFVPNNAFGQLLSIQPKPLIQAKTTDSIFDHIEIWFTDQNNNSLKINNSVSIALIIQNKA